MLDMLEKMCLPCLPVLLVCVLGIYARYPYIHLISFEFFLALFSISPPTLLTQAPPTPAKKRCL